MGIMRINLPLHFGTDSKEFEHFVRRKPTREELKEFARLLAQGVMSQIDWDIIGECAGGQFK